MIKDLMTTDEYNGYIKGQILGFLNNSDWKAIHDLLINEKLIEVKSERKIAEVKEEKKVDIVNKETNLSNKDTESINKRSKYNTDRFDYNKNVEKFKKNTKTYKMLERYIKFVIKHHNKNGQFYENENGEITLFYVDNEILIPLRNFKEFYKMKRFVSNWLSEIGSYFISGDILSYQKSKVGYFPYVNYSVRSQKKALYNGKFRKLVDIDIYKHSVLPVININPNFLKEINCYDEIIKLRG